MIVMLAGEPTADQVEALRKVHEALAARRGEDVTATTAELGIAADFVDTVVADALALPD